MRKYFLLLAVMLSVTAARSQIVTGCEYFFDTDPGIGNGAAVTVTPGDSVLLNLSVPVSLGDGFHHLYFRMQNIDGIWSLYEGRTFFIQPVPTPIIAQLTDAEYFFYTDPGLGNGTAFTVSTGDSIVVSTSVSTATLADGFHHLFVRAKNADGKWSLYEGRTFFIQPVATPITAQLTAAEYFYDTDPGVGNGTAFTVTSGDSLVISTTTPSAALANGFHHMFVRAQNADGKWSLYEGRTFFIQEPSSANLPQLTYAEYYFDSLDLGQGNATSMLVTPGDSIDASFIIPQSLPNGPHTMVVRCKNSNEVWSLNEGRLFTVGPISVPEIDPNTTALFQNFPNPLIQSTEILFNLVKPGDVTISFTDVLGKTVKKIYLQNLSSGKHSLIVERDELPGGCYIYQMTAGDFISSKQMMVMK